MLKSVEETFKKGEKKRKEKKSPTTHKLHFFCNPVLFFVLLLLFWGEGKFL